MPTSTITSLNGLISTLRTVVQKLVLFTALMVFAPLITFFLTQYVSGSSIISGGLAAAVANIVLVGYIVVAFNEDVKLEKTDEKEGEKLD
ncbi:hypothetical protein WICMUC_005951 [Wickerhamomyces mucosus]|uniref:Vacuolar ATPase assembly integral membrane protein VMA21 n=1 Tax=Wickerhamomyces mucosus TaxID=1378264 RepID=A0A9P8T2Y1_9ASCO|nr:hypothetical protein WICMUC_005951 [Wickerhamomyces mucosus]